MLPVNSLNKYNESYFKFTILTYNCLASDLAQTKYFPQTDSRFLDFSYRSKLFEQELKSFNADIICLQEIHIDDFHQWLKPFLFQLGYNDGTFAARGGQNAKDGVVIFFKKDKFKLVKQHRVSYFDSAQVQFPAQTTLATYNVALFCLLQIQNDETRTFDDMEQQIWISNTHLNWNCRLRATQFFQIRTLFAEFAQITRDMHYCPVLIVGDFNSTHDSVVHDYIRNGFLTNTSDYYSEIYDIFLPLFDNDSNKTIKYLTEPVINKMFLESAYNTNSFLMPFTTRVVNNFCGTIDYIYYQRDRMRPTQFLNALCDDGVRSLDEDFTLPNEQHPSDHLPLMVELELLSWQAGNDDKTTNK